jgi:hypothetical protein
MRSRTVRLIVAAAVLLALSGLPAPVLAYSVLSHEANIDALWDTSITAVIRARFPKVTAAELEEARAYAYGGCVIHDLGYYPFGSHFFSNLLHYVRTGDFVENLIAGAQDVNEFAFALGALSHYASDNNGHPLAVNRTVPIMYPKLRAKYGNSITYAQSPKSHILVEFSFDVVQVAAGAFAPKAYHRYIGFKVATPALERAFLETYGLEMKDLFLNQDLAIGTYRHAVAKTIPEMTKAAWKKKREEIEKVMPGVTRTDVVFNLSRQEYEKEFGTDYAKPHGFARFVSMVYALVPKIGPFRSLSFDVPTPEAEHLFLESFKATRERYAEALTALKGRRLNLANTDFDTGKPTARGEYSLADETYAELLNKHAEHKFARMPKALGANLVTYYGSQDPQVASLKVACACP